jgi:hypothetical protein
VPRKLDACVALLFIVVYQLQQTPVGWRTRLAIAAGFYGKSENL